MVRLRLQQKLHLRFDSRVLIRLFGKLHAPLAERDALEGPEGHFAVHYVELEFQGQYAPNDHGGKQCEYAFEIHKVCEDVALVDTHTAHLIRCCGGSTRQKSSNAGCQNLPAPTAYNRLHSSSTNIRNGRFGIRGICCRPFRYQFECLYRDLGSRSGLTIDNFFIASARVALNHQSSTNGHGHASATGGRF